MRCYTGWAQPWSVPTKQNFFVSNDKVPVTPAYLEHQRDLLEINLANCVTYLQALRKKHARGARQLDFDSYLPRKKKKKIQQNLRQLEKEIKYRERDEEAFLNNLQACKTNIYLAETVSSPSISVSTVPELVPDSALSPYPDESEPTELSWSGWSNTTAHSPILKKFSSFPLVNEMASEDYLSMEGVAVATQTGECSGSDSKCVEQTNAVCSLPMTSVPKQFTFRPEAAVFRPRAASKDQEE